MALRVADTGTTEVWARELANGDVAVGLLNKGDAPNAPGKDTCTWETYTGGYNESTGGSGGNDGCVNAQSIEAVKAQCCGLKAQCVSFSIPNNGRGEACLKKNDAAGWKPNAAYMSLVKITQGPVPPEPTGAVITAALSLVGWSHPTANVRDVYAKKDLGTMTELKATVPLHGLALFRLSSAAAV